MQRKEGPDKATSWNEAQAWINGLGNGWRTPTLVERKGINIFGSTRKGGVGSSVPLRLDPAFQLDKAVDVWSESKNFSSAWSFDFAYDCESWTDRYNFNVWFVSDDYYCLNRTFAVRSRLMMRVGTPIGEGEGWPGGRVRAGRDDTRPCGGIVLCAKRI